MRLNVLDVRLGPVYGDPFHLEEHELEQQEACPVCLDRDRQSCLALAEGSAGIGLAVAQCDLCQHVYLSRRPSVAWYRTYYARDWDQGRLASPAAGRLKTWLKATPGSRSAIALARRLRGGPDRSVFRGRLLTMLAGVGSAEALDAVPRRARLLEIGSGYGHALAVLQEAGFEVFGTEASQHRAAACRTAGFKVFDTAIDDFEPLLPLAPFDVVYSAHVFEHLTDLQRVMGRLAPLVRPGGIIYLEVPHGPVAENLVHRTHVPVHCHLFSAQSLATLLGRFGFAAIRVLTDVNLHVVAVKAEDTTLPEPRTGDWRDRLIRGAAALRMADGPVRFDYDHFYAEVTRIADDRTLFKRPSPYAIQPIIDPATRRLVNQFTLAAEPTQGDNADWPIRFIHPAPRPPMWLKRQ